LSLGVAGKWRFFVGPPGSGTLPHNHYNAINALARGRKRWAIYQGTEPGGTRRLLAESYRDYDSGSQARDWFVNDCPELRSRRNVRLWELAQAPGDVVFIPVRSSTRSSTSSRSSASGQSCSRQRRSRTPWARCGRAGPCAAVARCQAVARCEVGVDDGGEGRAPAGRRPPKAHTSCSAALSCPKRVANSSLSR
jgi:hypothetical protein